MTTFRSFVLATLVVFVLFGISFAQEENQDTTLPDYSEWEPFEEGLRHFNIQGSNVALKFVGYGFHESSEPHHIDEEVSVLFNTEGNPWLALYFIKIDEKITEEYLFEYTNETWVFVENMLSLNLEEFLDLLSIKYGLLPSV